MLKQKIIMHATNKLHTAQPANFRPIYVPARPKSAPWCTFTQTVKTLWFLETNVERNL